MSGRPHHDRTSACKVQQGRKGCLPEEESEVLAAAGWVAMRRGRFFRCSRMESVTGPSPMEVKKLMLNRMLRGVS